MDFNQNNRDRTIASAYSLRPIPGAPVSTPMTWDELAGVTDPADYNLFTVPDRVADGDPWAAIDDVRPRPRAAAGLWEELPGGELNFPPDYPKMPGEPPRVQPSKKVESHWDAEGRRIEHRVAWSRRSPGRAATEHPSRRTSTSYRETSHREVPLAVRRRAAGLAGTVRLVTRSSSSAPALMERRWLVWGFLGEPVDDPWGDSGGDDEGRWRVDADAAWTNIVALMEEYAARPRAILASHAPEEIASTGGRFHGFQPPDLRWICFHVLQEYARHAGHLDLVVELAGGHTGE